MAEEEKDYVTLDQLHQSQGPNDTDIMLLQQEDGEGKKVTVEQIKEHIAVYDNVLDPTSDNPIMNKAVAKIIPNQASEENKLADQEFVNSSISTNTAYFRGTFVSVEALEEYAGEKTNNDYAFVIVTDETGNTSYNRYKWTGEAWVFEYTLNNSSFTAEQWAAIQSGITAELVELLKSGGGSGIPIGTVLTYTSDNLPRGFLAFDDTQYLREDYPELYSRLPAYFIDDEDHFTLHNINDRVIQQANGNLGELIEAGLPNITGQFTRDESSINGNVTAGSNGTDIIGAFEGTGAQKRPTPSGTSSSYNGYRNITFTASKGETDINGNLKTDESSKVYGKSNTVQMAAVAFNYMVKATSFAEAREDVIDDTRATADNVWSAAKTKAEIGSVDNKNNYSTEEIIIGYWYDGRPIYRKTIVYSSPISVADNTDISVPNFDLSQVWAFLTCKLLRVREGTSSPMIVNANCRTESNKLRVLTYGASSYGNLTRLILEYVKIAQ